MSRIQKRFAQLKERNRKALIPYVTAGDPQPEVTVPMMHAMVEAGADLLELGVPFSDPMADGPVIQAACERALVHGTSLTDVLAMVKSFRDQDTDTPVILMGYLNPVEVMGYERFAHACKDAGVDGALIVDLPPEEGESLLDALRSVDVDAVFLLAPTSTQARIAKICNAASGFVYYVSLKGVTGAATLDVDSVKAKLADIERETSLPIGVGFGIRDAESAAAVAKVADAVVVGSAIVKKFGEHKEQPSLIQQDVVSLLQSMRAAMDQV
jgi:tryptophan synthase alpha chain